MKAADRHHPADERLIALYFGDEGASAEERKGVLQHLHGCEACTWRYTELTAPLQQLRQDAASEADEVFTPRRLEEQRVSIRRRLEEGARASRILPFPAARPAVSPSGRRPIVRWVAAAAAAGLIVGVSAGRFLDLRRLPHVGTTASSQARSTTRPLAIVTDSPAPSDAGAYEQVDFLSEIDLALRHQRISELQALEALTPHPREAVLALK